MSKDPLRRALTVLLVGAVAACAAPTGRDPFTETGEVIAMSGGDAGPERACFACHGLRGQGDGELAPRLAGLPEGYLQKQLEDYADGLRPHELMRVVSRALDPEDRRRVAAYYAAMPPPVSSGPTTDLRGSRLYHRGAPERGLPACAACHGRAGQGVGPANPPLAGQPPGYLASQMKQWRRSERRNDPRGVMLTISRRLTSAEVEALARYAAAPGPQAVPPSGFQAASP